MQRHLPGHMFEDCLYGMLCDPGYCGKPIVRKNPQSMAESCLCAGRQPRKSRMRHDLWQLSQPVSIVAFAIRFGILYALLVNCTWLYHHILIGAILITALMSAVEHLIGWGRSQFRKHRGGG